MLRLLTQNFNSPSENKCVPLAVKCSERTEMSASDSKRQPVAGKRPAEISSNRGAPVQQTSSYQEKGARNDHRPITLRQLRAGRPYPIQYYSSSSSSDCSSEDESKGEKQHGGNASDCPKGVCSRERTLLNSLDLATGGLIGRPASRWEAELERLQEAGKPRPAPPAFSEPELPHWTRSLVPLGQSRWLSLEVVSRTLGQCPACGDRVRAREVEEHTARCFGRWSQYEPVPASEREEAAKRVLFAYWESVLHMPEPDAYEERLSELLARFGASRRAARGPPLLLRQLTAVSLPYKTFSFPAPIGTILAGVPSRTVGYAIRAAYVALLSFLRHLLGTALKKGYLSEPKFACRDRTLEHLLDRAKEAVLQPTTVGLGFEVAFGPAFHRDHPVAERPDLRRAYRSYTEDPLRQELLDRIIALAPRAQRRDSLTHPDGTELLGPVFVRNFLALEVYLREGATSEAVLQTTLGQFLSPPEHPISPRHAGKEHSWATPLSGPSENGVLTADATLASALRSFAKYLRPAFLKGLLPRDSHRLPLFPLQGGRQMKTLASCLHPFFKLGGGERGGWNLTPSTLSALKGEASRDLRIRHILSESLY